MTKFNSIHTTYTPHCLYCSYCAVRHPRNFSNRHLFHPWVDSKQLRKLPLGQLLPRRHQSEICFLQHRIRSTPPTLVVYAQVLKPTDFVFLLVETCISLMGLSLIRMVRSVETKRMRGTKNNEDKKKKNSFWFFVSSLFLTLCSIKSYNTLRIAFKRSVYSNRVLHKTTAVGSHCCGICVPTVVGLLWDLCFLTSPRSSIFYTYSFLFSQKNDASGTQGLWCASLRRGKYALNRRVSGQEEIILRLTVAPV